MWQYFFLTLRRKPGQSFLAGSGFLLVACTLILLSATTLTTVLRTKQIISQNWRPAYDLVVLPRQVALPNGKAVPPDFFESYDGGISLRQYEQIRQIAGVEVAAPIAFIGYVQLPRPVIRFSPRSGAPGYYLVHWTLTAFNGRRNLVEQERSTISSSSARDLLIQNSR